MIPKSEVRTKQYLQRNGYEFIRSGRSHGVWDFVAYNEREILFIQAKFRQGPGSEELARLRLFSKYPKVGVVKRQIWLWRERAHDPEITTLEEGGNHGAALQN